MYFSNAITIAASALALCGTVAASPAPAVGPQARAAAKSFCPNKEDDVDTGRRLNLFKQFNTLLFSGSQTPANVAAAFAQYVSPNLIEHTASANSYGADVGFLTALFPTVDITIIPGLQDCFPTNENTNKGICAIHYKATPKPGVQSFITNTTVISDFYKYDGVCITEHWDSTQTANAATTNPGFPGA
ncbi:hypothetical protein BT63DRAFT_413289 [Microthyrium microscopicum]|uniref:SnoaL-like domain-containing protein n=1 Tax=Microthyrium microscopicum TaxID=703497 RepID=A0A6A6UHL3_9PEZI|nr:hypothetical protein BT63DRAFT_413289 [Microthyrium microscopicum]